MAQRHITFTDADNNPLILRLDGDRAQLDVIDCSPELAGDELRAFATALFGATLAGPLADRLVGALKQLAGVRAQLADDQAAALTAALGAPIAAIADVAAALAAASAAVADEPADAPRGDRLGESDGVLGWGWLRYTDGSSAA